MKSKGITREKIDSLCEKIEANVADMHRPIVASRTANFATIEDVLARRKLGPDLNPLTFEYVRQTNRLDQIDETSGVVTSFNNNTYKGRLYSFSERRPIPLELMYDARTRDNVGVLTRSQHMHGQDRADPRAAVTLSAHRLESAVGSLKRLHVVDARRTDDLSG